MICIEEQHPAFERYHIQVNTLLDFESVNLSEFYKDIFNQPPAQFFLCEFTAFTKPPNGVFSFIQHYLHINKERKCSFYPISFWKDIYSVSVKDGISTYTEGGREAKLKFFELDITELDTSLSDFVDFDFQLSPGDNDGFVFFSERGNWLLIDSDRLNLCLIVLYDDTWRKSKPIVDLLKTEACDLESIGYSVRFIYNEEHVKQFYEQHLSLIEKSLKTLEEV